MTSFSRYNNRVHAGQVLAQALREVGRIRPVVLALPRGGVVVAAEIARAIDAPLDVFLVRKLGLPSLPETGMGAIASGGVRVLNEDLIAGAAVSPGAIAEITERETEVLERREALYRSGRPPLQIAEHTVILVDDGMATGFTFRAALTALKRQRPAHVLIAVPVGAPQTCRELAPLVDLLFCPLRPDPFGAVGLWYDHFEPVEDEEVVRVLSDSAGRR